MTLEPERRDFLGHAAKVAALLATAGFLPAARASWPAAAFDANSLNDVARAMGAGTPVESKDVSITGPDIAENGAVVPVTVATALPGAKKLLLLVEKNPNALSAAFDLGDGIDPAFATRVKMSQSSNVYAVALTGDGKAFFARREIKVTLGGCGG